MLAIDGEGINLPIQGFQFVSMLAKFIMDLKWTEPHRLEFSMFSLILMGFIPF